jgi:GT2 family glycosyltransferase
MELSIIIVSYNVKFFLEQCLLSVRKATENINCEIFVVDNNSVDGSCSMIAREFPEVKLIMNHDNKGFSAANNQALKLAAGRYILLLNPDTLVEEDTFIKCIRFMDEHPDAGATGVKLINGKGKILPESKRALPTPKTAFFKIFGFASIFPRSKVFNKYYLGHLDYLNTTKAEVLTGAFMFLRREAVLKTGFLDETFFMYGEDIDYSYRLLKAGYNNYYYPETKIVHYKGESTKKENLNVLINFYNAMIIFVRKHFSNGNLKAFIFPVQVAIFLRAGLSLFKRLIKRIFLPLSDGIIIYFLYRLVISFWEIHKFGTSYKYPDIFTEIIVPGYTLIILFSIGLFSGYKIPSKIDSTVKGISMGTVIILIVYAMLPLDLRFSRAIIIFGGLLSVLVVLLWRLLISLTGMELAENPFAKSKRTIVISNPEEYERVEELMSSSGISKRIAGRVSISRDDMSEEVLGNIDQIREVIRINRIREVIFTTGEMTASQIIDLMHLLSDLNITLKIASASGKYILGSKYVNSQEDILPLKKSPFRKKIINKLLDIFK